MEKIKLKRLAIILGIMLAIAVQIIFNTYDKEEEILCDVFANSNAISNLGEFIITGEIQDEYMTDDDVRGMLKYIAKLAGVENKSCTISKKEGKWHLEGEEDFVKVVIDTDRFNEENLPLIKIEAESKNENGIVDNKMLFKIRSLINDSFAEMNIEKLDDSIILKGCYMGRLNNQFIDENTEKMYRIMEGKEIKQKNINGIYYSYGYTDKICEYVDVDSGKININIVYTYDEEMNVTWIYLGSPIINIDY